MARSSLAGLPTGCMLRPSMTKEGREGELLPSKELDQFRAQGPNEEPELQPPRSRRSSNPSWFNNLEHIAPSDQAMAIAHYAQYLKRKYPSLDDDTRMEYTGLLILFPLFLEFVVEVDRQDEQTRKQFPHLSWRPWYERVRSVQKGG